MTINAWGSDDPAEVAKGGTGRNTLTDNALLIGKGTNPVDFVVLTDGQVPIGNTGGAPTGATINGTPDEIVVTSGPGSITIGIADNAILPGTGAYTWVDGTTAQEPAGSNGQTRYDTTTNKFRGYENGAWVDFITGTSPGAGGWVYLSTATASASTSLDFDSTVIADPYIGFMFIFEGINVGTNQFYLLSELSPDNGTTWRTSSYISLGVGGSVGAGYAQVSSVSNFRLGLQARNGLDVVGQYFLWNALASGLTSFTGFGSEAHYSTTDHYAWTHSSLYNVSEAINSIRFRSSVGTITSGNIKCYGIRET